MDFFLQKQFPLELFSHCPMLTYIAVVPLDCMGKYFGQKRGGDRFNSKINREEIQFFSFCKIICNCPYYLF